MTTSNEYPSRALSSDTEQVLTAYQHGQVRYVFDAPAVLRAGVQYRLRLDPHTRTAWLEEQA
jgi:hypothetical protein